MAVKTRKIALVSTKVPKFKRRPSGGGSGAAAPPAEAPQGIAALPSSISVAEGTAPGTYLTTFATTPLGLPIALTNDAGGRFTLVGNDLKTGSVPTDYETATSHQVIITATQGILTLDVPFTVNVTNVNELTDITLNNQTMSENTAAGGVVGALASVIAGATFSLTDNAGNRFAISGNNLVAGSVPANFETQSSHNITVLATKGTDTFSKTFTIAILDVDEISDITLGGSTILENAGQGTPVGDLTSSPSGATFELLDDAGGHFQLTSGRFIESGTVSPQLVDGSYDISVRGTRGGETFTKTFTITVEADV